MIYYNSPFNIVVSSSDKSSTVHNLVTNTVYVFRERWNTILDGANANKDLANELLKRSLIVNSDDYITNVKNYFQLKDTSNKRLLFYFTLTTKCEFHCKYCFQNNIKRSDSSPEVIQQFVDWLHEYLSSFSQNFEEIFLVIFGGDPITRSDLSCLLLKFVSKICNTHNLKMRSIMTTNGTVADTDLINKLRKNGLQTIQVSFEGPRDIHNLTRPGSYDTILSNLIKYQNHFHLRIKYNIWKANSDRPVFEKFLDDLEKQKITRECIIVLESIQETTTNLGPKSGCYQYNDPLLGQIFTQFVEIGKKRGFRISLKSAFQPPCMFTSRNSYLIDTNGDIYNCDTAFGIKNFRVGNIFKTPLIKIDKNKNREPIFNLAMRVCAKKRCPYFPICETGCYFYRYVKNLKFNDSLCRESYISSFFPLLTKIFQREVK
ncbi:MAG: radical SAM protein [bacterium]